MKANTGAFSSPAIEECGSWSALALDGALFSASDVDAWNSSARTGLTELAAAANVVAQLPTASSASYRISEQIHQALEQIAADVKAITSRTKRHVAALNEACDRVEQAIREAATAQDKAQASERVAAARRDLDAVRRQKW